MSQPKSERPRLPQGSFSGATGVKMHYFLFNIGDYASHTRHLDLMEDLAYRRLLDLYYLHERPLNTDATVVARQILMRDHADTVRQVLEEFFELTDDGYRSARADKEIQQFHNKIEQASRAGKASAERRMNARSTPVQPTNNQEPINNNQEPELDPNGSCDLGKPKSPPAPIKEIVDLYNSLLPELPACVVLNDSRKKTIASRWRDVVTADKLDRQGGLEFFRWFFNMVRDSDFLMGKKKPWKADIDFLFTASKFPRIIEGVYHRSDK